jgi:hypothetical protein
MLATAETWTTASRSARPWRPTSRWRSTTSATSPPLHPRPGRPALELDDETYAYHFHEPLGVVGQIIPWNFPILMAVWKLAPALAAGNCVVLKPAEQTPASILVLMELIGDLLPPGVLNVVNGFGLEAGKPLASSKRIAKIAFTGETTTGRLIMQYAAQNLIPVTLELGGKSPNIFFEDVMDADDAFYDKAWKASPCSRSTRAKSAPARRARWSRNRSTSPSWSDALARVEKMIKGQSARHRDHDRRAGLATTSWKRSSPTSTSAAGRRQGAGRRRARRTARGRPGRRLLRPADVFEGHNKMRIFQEEIFGPVVSVTTFKDYADALGIANDTLYGLGAGLWTRDGNARTASAARSRPAASGPTATTLPGARRVRRLQAVGHRAREPQDDARPLPADQEPAGQLRREADAARGAVDFDQRDGLLRFEIDHVDIVRFLVAGEQPAAFRVVHAMLGIASPHVDRAGAGQRRDVDEHGLVGFLRTHRERLAVGRQLDAFRCFASWNGFLQRAGPGVDREYHARVRIDDEQCLAAAIERDALDFFAEAGLAEQARRCRLAFADVDHADRAIAFVGHVSTLGLRGAAREQRGRNAGHC